MNIRKLVSRVCVTVVLAGCGGSRSVSELPQLESTSQRPLSNRAYEIVHPFGRSKTDGENPAADLINVKGTLYGTTAYGGTNGVGTVFSITPSGHETVLHSFGVLTSSADGALPMGRLVNVNGTLYGTTFIGGAHDAGTVFSIAPDGTEKILHSFASNYQSGRGNTGSLPQAGLIDVKGTLYGTTSQGGEHPCNTEVYCGAVFSITTSGKYKLLYSFSGRSGDGNYPQAPLLNVNGTLYGTTAGGGEYFGNGTVFSITTSGDYKRVYSFGGSQSDGQYPVSALINVQGVLYGTTMGGGSGGHGTVFSLTTDGSEKLVYSFSANGGDGGSPAAALRNVNGVLYGTTKGGGANNFGTVFKLTKSGKETVLHSFAKGDGITPAAGVIAVAGTLYGTTYGSSTHGVMRSFGNVFSLEP